MKQRQTPAIQLVFAGRRRENRIPNYSELLSSLESTRMCLYMYNSPPDRGPTRLSLSCSFIPVAPPVFLVVMLELLHGVPLGIASSSLLLPISRGSVSHRQTLHQRPHEVQKARRLPLIEEFARQSACAATDVYAVCAVWRFQTSMSPFSDCGVHPPEQLARLQTLKQPMLVRGEPLRKLRSIAPTLEECCIYVQQNIAEP
jgi:hypothetical protein